MVDVTSITAELDALGEHARKAYGGSTGSRTEGRGDADPLDRHAVMEEVGVVKFLAAGIDAGSWMWSL